MDPKLLQFIQLLEKWNKTYNLTAIRDPNKMITHHLLDSLAIIPFITGSHILDLGTGAGLPGIPLAITAPHKEFTLVDSNNKKIQFLLYVKSELALTNVDVVQARWETMNTAQHFDHIICRALGAMQDIVSKSEYLLKNSGNWLFMKGKYPHAEIKALSYPYKVERLKVAGLHAERHLVMVHRNKKG